MKKSYGEKSYHPDVFEIDFWGTKAGDSCEYRDFKRRKIKGNILITAYYCPVTAQEISIELGVSLPYLEDEIELLIERKYLVCKNGKYLTNIPIFTTDCTKTINEKLKKVTEAAANEFIKTADEFSKRFRNRFENENLMRWQKVLMCLHFSLIETGNDLGKIYGDMPTDGPYSLVNGGGGQGIVWGRSKTIVEDELPQGIQGIYNEYPSDDGKGSIIAMNFTQTLNAQHFEGNMTAPIVCTAADCFEALPNYLKDQLEKSGYAINGKANFTVYSKKEYADLSSILGKCVDIVSELNRKTSEIAATVTADLAPSHIRKTAEYVGAFIYRFNSVENLVDSLYNMKWLKPVDNIEKPAISVVIN